MNENRPDCCCGGGCVGGCIGGCVGGCIGGDTWFPGKPAAGNIDGNGEVLLDWKLNSEEAVGG